MSDTAAMVEALKRILRARKINYAGVAKALKLSEATVKRMFSAADFSLERFEKVCEMAGVGVTELAREVDSERNYLSRLTLAQEKEIVSNPKLFLVAVCVLNHLTLEQILATYELSKTECLQLLLRLDHIRFIELLPNNRIKLKVSRTFSWLPGGPIQRFFLESAEREYFRSGFERPGEYVAVINGMLSQAATAQMIAKLQRVARDFSDMHEDDKHLPLGDRRLASIVLAIRPWELDVFHRWRRNKSR